MSSLPPLWVDTDAGFDDLLALGALASSKRLRLVTVGSGACETPSIGAERIARFLGAVGRSDVEVVAGAAAASITVLPWLATARKDMVEWFEKELSAEEGTFDGSVEDALLRLAEPPDVLCLGPLANVADGLRFLKPRSVTVMGGNRLEDSTSAEFNFECDPAAAAAVLRDAPALTIVGLDACDSVAGAVELSQCDGLLASLIKKGGAYTVMCDPVAAYAVVSGDSFETRLTAATVTASGILSPSGGERSVAVATRLRDRESYIAWLREAVSKKAR